MNKNSVKLGTRLSLAFAALVLLTIAVGGLALVQLSGMNTRTQDIAENWLPSIKMLGEMRTAANQLRRQEADHVLSVEAAEMAAIEGRMAEIQICLGGQAKGLRANDCHS
ncbi:MCP four helix bundle domain-containing protein [Azohydromonas aeria]|uniref:MCP four helix bundle domain-containing protein n=1 Tax=Azohydromonas aeria TaxID=2590212 RepID=UPI0012FCE1AA|nr:MCP four helix bundle domain-containing protein [Azohydromonas aeria]